MTIQIERMEQVTAVGVESVSLVTQRAPMVLIHTIRSVKAVKGRLTYF